MFLAKYFNNLDFFDMVDRKSGESMILQHLKFCFGCRQSSANWFSIFPILHHEDIIIKIVVFYDVKPVYWLGRIWPASCMAIGIHARAIFNTVQ